jgi:uncharacterized protein YjcR
MGQGLYASARTTAAVRRAIQHCQESLKKLAERYDIHPKTVAKWKKRTDVHDAVLTDNGTPFTELTHFRKGAEKPQEAQHPEGL